MSKLYDLTLVKNLAATNKLHLIDFWADDLWALVPEHLKTLVVKYPIDYEFLKNEQGITEIRLFALIDNKDDYVILKLLIDNE